MYDIEDRVAALKEVQRLLSVNQTGVYDNNTRDAVKIIQAAYSYDNKDEVDYTTFTYILQEYLKREAKKVKTDYLFSPKFPYTESDLDENVRLINEALKIVLKDYAYEGNYPDGKYFGVNTINAVNFLRAIFRLTPMNEIDEEFLNRLLLEKNAIELKKKYG